MLQYCAEKRMMAVCEKLRKDMEAQVAAYAPHTPRPVLA